MKSSEATLERGICEVFPSANPRRLAEWALQTQASAGIDVEPLLFSALIAGAHFRITHPEVAFVRDELRTWLTQQKLGSDLADLLVKTWTPGLARELKQRGWQRGWQGPHIRQPGRPPTARGAWVVALLVDYLLTHSGGKKTPDRATALALLLLGRDFRGRDAPGEVGDLSDFYKFRQRIPPTAVSKLAGKIVEAYEFLLQQDGVRQGDMPSSSAPHWRARHKNLRVILEEFTPIGVAEWMLQLKIPDSLWEPFWPPKRRRQARSVRAHVRQKPRPK